MANAMLRELLDLKIFVDADDDIRFIHRLQRDLEERQRTMGSVINQYLRTVRPAHIRFVETSKKFADIIILDVQNRTAVKGIVHMVKSMIATR